MGKIIPKSLVAVIILLSFAPASFSQIKRDTKQAQSYRAQGYDAQRVGNLDVALSYYTRAAELDPFYAVAFNDMGIIFEAKGDINRAKQAYQKAVSIDPNYLSAYYNLAALFEKEGDFDKAAYYWQMRVNLGDWSDAWTWKAKERLDGLEASNKVDKNNMPVAGNLDFSLNPDPKRRAAYHFQHARQLNARGEYIKALKELNDAVVLDPKNVDIRELLEDTQLKVLQYN